MKDSSLLGDKDYHMVGNEKISSGQSSTPLLQAVCPSVFFMESVPDPHSSVSACTVESLSLFCTGHYV
jgi:hypothetical protein